jgi:hypothetical protein
MKNVLPFFVQYITVLLIGAFAGIACVYLFFLCTSLTAGGGIVYPPLSIVLTFVPLSCACAAILSCFCLITRIARHRDYSLLAILVCMALHLATWLIFFPVGDKVLTSIIRQVQSQTTWQPESISPGYFRQTDEGIFYYFRVNEDKTGDGVFIGLTPNAETFLQLFPLNHAPLVPEFLDGDLLIQRTVAFPPVLSVVLRLFAEFGANARAAFQRGILAWYAFASVCLPLTALITFAHVSRWRLNNFCLLSLTFSAICLSNLAYFENAISDKLSGFTGFFRALPVLNRLQQDAEAYILLVVFNILLAVIIGFVGFRAYIRKKRAPDMGVLPI